MHILFPDKRIFDPAASIIADLFFIFYLTKHLDAVPVAYLPECSSMPLLDAAGRSWVRHES